MYSRFINKKSWRQIWEEKKRSQAIRAIAKAYDDSRKKSDSQSFIDFAQTQFGRLSWMFFRRSVPVSALNDFVGEFATRMFSGILLSNEIINNSILSSEETLTPDLLDDYVRHHSSVLNNQTAVSEAKALIIECVRNFLTHRFGKKSATQKPAFIYILNNTTHELLQKTESDFITKYSNQIQLKNNQNSLSVTVDFPDCELMSSFFALKHQVKVLEKLIEQEEYKKYKTAVLEILWELKYQGDNSDKLSCYCIDILKNAHALILETEAPVVGVYKEGACVDDLSQQDNAFKRYTDSVDRLMRSSTLMHERKKNIVKACVGLAGVVLLVGAVVALSATAFPVVLVGTCLAFAGLMMIQGGVHSFFRTAADSAHSLASRFKNVGLFADKVTNRETNPDEQSNLIPLQAYH